MNKKELIATKCALKWAIDWLLKDKELLDDEIINLKVELRKIENELY